jgi:hypothetical protein
MIARGGKRRKRRGREGKGMEGKGRKERGKITTYIAPSSIIGIYYLNSIKILIYSIYKVKRKRN